MGNLFKWLCLSLLPIALAQNYCSVCRDHTMCRFTSKNPACGEDSESGVSQAEAREIVNLHNAYRAKIANGQETRGRPGPQPPAGNMQALVWDDKLAEVAQRWADQCTFLHDQCRNEPQFKVGQNIYWSSGFSTVNWTRAVSSWYNEVQNFSAQNANNFYLDQPTGHYTQIAWATTTLIGCGRTTYGGAYRLQGYRRREFILAATPERNDTANRRVKKQNDPGFFGGATFDPAGAQGAITSSSGGVSESTGSSNGNRPLIPIGGNFPSKGNIGSLPNYPSSNGGSRPSNPSYPNYLNFPSGGIKPNYPIHPVSPEDYPEDYDMNIDYYPQPSDQYPILIPAASVPVDNEDLPHKWMPTYYNFVGRDQILICNYGPAGNWVGEPLYMQGEACSRCPSGTTCSSGLCVAS